jgi:hypothetical protein
MANWLAQKIISEAYSADELEQLRQIRQGTHEDKDHESSAEEGNPDEVKNQNEVPDG